MDVIYNKYFSSKIIQKINDINFIDSNKLSSDITMQIFYLIFKIIYKNPPNSNKINDAVISREKIFNEIINKYISLEVIDNETIEKIFLYIINKNEDEIMSNKIAFRSLIKHYKDIFLNYQVFIK